MSFNKKSCSMSYEEERSQLDFDEVVRQNQQKYKGETKLTNEQVLRSISNYCGKRAGIYIEIK